MFSEIKNWNKIYLKANENNILTEHKPFLYAYYELKI